MTAARHEEPLENDPAGRRPTLALVATAVALLVPGLAAPLLPDFARTASAALGLLILPGDIVARAVGIRANGLAERFAISFTFSLAALVPCLLLALGCGAGLGVVVGALLALCAVASRAPGLRASKHPRTVHAEAPADGDDVPSVTATAAAAPGPLLVAVTAFAVVMLTLAAVAVTRTGSVDRWWYLGYVHTWMAGPLTPAEPFLGTGFIQPRFAFHTWLGALAVWAHCARVDPLWLWDRDCPALLMPLAFAAQAMLGRALFRTRRGTLLTALCAGLLWAGGGPIAGLTRLPEDKVLAALVLSPVLWAAGVHACESGGAWIAASALAAGALATIHPLGFIVSAGPAIAFAVLRARRTPSLRPRIAAFVLVLLAASSYPLASGWMVRRAYVSEGAAALAADHPVARVHRSRQRLVEIGKLGYIVDPRLLAHPIVVLALAGVPLLYRRGWRERAFLAPAALAPLALAFVPPLPAAAGTIILPWMVHRVLWAIPFGALATVAAEELADAIGGRTGIVALLVLALALPSARSAAVARTREEREALGLPASALLREMLDAVRELPAGSLLAAAPELSERLPGLTGVRVLAMSDRATVVFAGSRTAGEARLRERAAVFTGIWKPGADAPAPTHVLYAAAGSPAARYCVRELLHNDAFVLCAFADAPAPPAARLPEVGQESDGERRAGIAALLAAPSTTSTGPTRTVRTAATAARCEPQPIVGRSGAAVLIRPRPGPWSPEFPLLSCTVEQPGGSLFPRTLVLAPALGTAVEELSIQVTGFAGGQLRWRVRTRRRAHNGETLRFGLPNAEADRVLVEVAPSFLPFIKLRTFELTMNEAADTP